MGHEENKNDELRDEHREQDAHRQKLRDAAGGETAEAVADLGSQDERRKEGEGRI